MNKTSILFIFALLAVASASVSIETVEEPKSFATGTVSWGAGELYLFAIGLVAVGLVNLLFGLKYYKIIIFLIGFCGGMIVGFFIGLLTTDAPTKTSLLLYALGVGLIGGCLFYFCYHCSIFTLGFMLGGVIIAVLGARIGLDGGILGVLFLLAGIGGGIVALKVHDIIVVLATSFSGAGYITYALTIFIHGVEFAAHSADIIYSLIALALAIGGIVYQFKTKTINTEDLQRTSISSPDVYVIDMNNGANPYNPYTGRKF